MKELIGVFVEGAGGGGGDGAMIVSSLLGGGRGQTELERDWLSDTIKVADCVPPSRAVITISQVLAVVVVQFRTISIIINTIINLGNRSSTGTLVQ